jgi:hypothetical protein
VSLVWQDVSRAIARREKKKKKKERKRGIDPKGKIDCIIRRTPEPNNHGIPILQRYSLTRKQ